MSDGKLSNAYHVAFILIIFGTLNQRNYCLRFLIMSTVTILYDSLFDKI